MKLLVCGLVLMLCTVNVSGESAIGLRRAARLARLKAALPHHPQIKRCHGLKKRANLAACFKIAHADYGLAHAQYNYYLCRRRYPKGSPTPECKKLSHNIGAAYARYRKAQSANRFAYSHYHGWRQSRGRPRSAPAPKPPAPKPYYQRCGHLSLKGANLVACKKIAGALYHLAHASYNFNRCLKNHARSECKNKYRREYKYGQKTIRANMRAYRRYFRSPACRCRISPRLRRCRHVARAERGKCRREAWRHYRKCRKSNYTKCSRSRN